MKPQTNSQVIAHRGAWKRAGLPQNSIASLQEAIRMGCEGSEFDIWMTADGVLVASHDPVHQGLSIEKTAYHDLKRWKLANGENLPTLEDHLTELQKHPDIQLVIEVKPSELAPTRTVETTHRALNAVSALELDLRVQFISFSLDACQEIGLGDSASRVAYLAGDLTPKQVADLGVRGVNYSHKVFKKHPEWIRQAQELGLTVNAWTVNDERTMRSLLDQGIDFITTDEPGLLMKILA